MRAVPTVTPEQTAQALVRRFTAQLEERRKLLAGAKEAVLREVPPIGARFRASRVFLFGSLAWGEGHEGSDIDLAVEGVPVEQRSACAAALSTALPLPVDVLSLEELPEPFRRRILEQGLVVYEEAR